MGTYVSIFVSVFLAELGDKTQLATLLFATDARVSRLGVFAAAAGALVASSAIAVAAGSYLGAWLQPAYLKTGAGLAFIAIGIWMLLGRG
jgi:putative Ca2+/H+ antiporter (TMEM165/GDT1 family)